MRGVKPTLTVISGRPDGRRQSAIEAAYEHFKLDREGRNIRATTVDYYKFMLLPFLRFLSEEAPHVLSFESLDVNVIRAYRAAVASRTGRHGRRLTSISKKGRDKGLMAFLRWAKKEGYEIDERIFALDRVKAELPDPIVYHISQIKAILDACDPQMPQEELVVRILVGSGIRESELCGLAAVAPDGMSDLMVDSLIHGRVELRVRGEAGAKGGKTRRVPINPKLGAAIKRYEARNRRGNESKSLILNSLGRPYGRFGIVAMMDRLERRVGFRVHAHAFRHTFATVACKLQWNYDLLKAALGHSDYKVMQRYVHVSRVQDLGPKKPWLDLIATDPAADWT